MLDDAKNVFQTTFPFDENYFDNQFTLIKHLRLITKILKISPFLSRYILFRKVFLPINLFEVKSWSF